MTAPAAAQKAVPVAAAPRMTLASVTKGVQKGAPLKVLLYGIEGVGKSTFGAKSPAPIFLGAEDGTKHLDTSRFPAPENWAHAMEAVRTLTVEAHQFKTLVVDTLDWMEPLIWGSICERDDKKSIEDYGFGKGYTAALDEWRIFLAAVERLVRAKGMNVILLAHSWAKPFKNPEGPDYDRYEMKLNAKAGGLVKEWADAVLFSAYETYANTDDKTKRTRGVATGARLIYTERTAAYDAKNRYGLPSSLPLSWADFAAAVEAGRPAPAAEVRAEIEKLKAKLLPEDAAKLPKALEVCGDDAQALAELRNRVRVKASAAESKAEAAK
jgi:AAA domain